MPKKQSKPIVKVIKKEPAKEPTTELSITKKAPTIRENTKMFKLVEMIKAPEGATLKQMTESLKWQPHTVRGALSRLNKTYNVGVINDKIASGDRVYKLSKKDEKNEKVHLIDLTVKARGATVVEPSRGIQQ